jgi:electron transfer flavoprotein-quinone oxidoreductase
MSADKYEVIIIGGGPAGLAAAYKLAQSGVEVVLVERGDSSGSKNLSGGVFYTRVLDKLIPGFWEEAPVERYITNYVTTLMDKEDYFNLEYKGKALGDAPYNAFSVLRAKFGRWLAEKAEEAGAMLVNGIKVEKVIKEGDKVVGIVAGDEEMMADVVIAADGINSFIAQEAGLRGPIKPLHLAVGAKALIVLPKEKIEDRFRLQVMKEPLTQARRAPWSCGGSFPYTTLYPVHGVVLRCDIVKDRLIPVDFFMTYWSIQVAPWLKTEK